jgi:murein DD-endopeptidase MepM/ murein hydrolase activator NlpD
MNSALSDLIHRRIKPKLESMGGAFGPILVLGWTGSLSMRLRRFALAGGMCGILFFSGLSAFALYAPEGAYGAAGGSGDIFGRSRAATDNDSRLDGFIQVVALSHWEGMSTRAPSDDVDPLQLLLAAYTPPVGHAEESSVTVESGDNLFGVLTKAGVLTNHAEQVINSLGELYDPRRDLRAGQEVALIFDQELEFRGEVGDGRQLASLILPVSFDRNVIVRRDGGGYMAEEIVRELETRYERGSGFINSSLFAAGADAGVPQGVLANLIQLYSFDVDFQRELRQGDSFEVVYETLYDKDTGEQIQYGDIMFASLTISSSRLPLYRFENSDGRLDYYDHSGQSARRALMKTPIEGARVSSNFGMRRHPILGYSRMHEGTDFAAPTGTPIYAAGDGTIETIGTNGGYGKYIRIRHNGSYKTAYAHMSGYATGLRQGSRVTQGQIIGFVGTTGRSTGAHLHYEVIRDGDKMNPAALDLPRGEKLEGGDLVAFKQFRDDLVRRYDLVTSDGLLAEASNAGQ